MSIPSKHFYMIRHGQTEANAAKIMAGSLDSPLTTGGIEEAKRAAKILPHLEIKPKAVFHSNLSRARDTAHILNEKLNVPMFENADLAEMHAGDWEGVPYSNCQDMLHGWTNPPNGETYDEFFVRIKRAKIKALSHANGPVLIVCHGGVFRAFSKLFEISTFGVRNCHLYEFESSPETPDFPWKSWHYEYYDGKTPALQCDCTVENWVPMTKPSSMTPSTRIESHKINKNVMRTACDIFHADNISPTSSPADKIAS